MKSEVAHYLKCIESLEKMEQSGDLLINSVRGGVVMSMLLWEYFFTDGYLKNSDDRRILAFLDKVRATINFRRGSMAAIEKNVGTTKMLQPEEPLYITVASAADASKPAFIGCQVGETLKVEEYKDDGSISK